MAAILENRRFRDFDWSMVLLALAIALFGTWQIYNAQPDLNFWKKQLIGLGVSTVVMFAVAVTDYRKLINIAPLFYAAGLVLLALVLVPGIGHKVNGQQAWILIPGLGTFQPSEFVKIPTVLMLARYFGKHRSGPLSVRAMLMGAAILALPLALIMLEPDAGQAITYMPLLAVVLFLSSVRMWIVISALVLSTIAIPAAYIVGVEKGFIKDYQQQRINVILDPENADRRGYGYHTWQSILTVGKGGITGSDAAGEASQSRLKYLPEPHTDFIYAVTAENTGFIGSVLLLLAYAVLLSKLMAGARRAPDRSGMLVIMAIVGGLAFQIFINVGMALGLLPVIGVPLPLMSAGLSAILATSIAIGFAISIRLRRFVN
jgi:rod shape determining protein RodA